MGVCRSQGELELLGDGWVRRDKQDDAIGRSASHFLTTWVMFSISYVMDQIWNRRLEPVLLVLQKNEAKLGLEVNPVRVNWGLPTLRRHHSKHWWTGIGSIDMGKIPEQEFTQQILDN